MTFSYQTIHKIIYIVSYDLLPRITDLKIGMETYLHRVKDGNNILKNKHGNFCRHRETMVSDIILRREFVSRKKTTTTIRNFVLFHVETSSTTEKIQATLFPPCVFENGTARGVERILDAIPCKIK